MFQEYIATPQQLRALTEAEFRSFHTVINCHICNQPLGGDKVRDHCHIVGSYRGNAHSRCNLEYRISKYDWKLPVVLHNLKGYDGHLIVKALKSEFAEARVIPQNMEKYLFITVGSLAFIDSLKFTFQSLDSLVKTLEVDEFKYVRDAFPVAHEFELIKRKGVARFSYYFYFLFYVYCLLYAHFTPPPTSPPTRRKSLDFCNETIVNPTNYKIEINFSNILQICVVSFGIIILLWLSYLYTICNHVRYVCFAANLSLLSKEKTFISSQVLSILLSILILGLLFEIEDDQILLFIIRMNPNHEILLQLFFNLRKIISRFSIAITPVACTLSLIVFQIWSCSLRKKARLVTHLTHFNFKSHSYEPRNPIPFSK